MDNAGFDAIPDVRFIRDVAAARDELESHSRLARAVGAALLADRSLRVVGLFGSWGSGKSTVVKLVEQDLSARRVQFFTYDAWLHQSDAPRRAFLEEFLRFLERQSCFDDTLAPELDRILGKTERTETIARPSIPIWVGFVLGTLALSPLAFQFLRPDWAKSREFGYVEVAGYGAGAPYATALLVALLPFGLLVAANLWRAVRRKPGDASSGVVALFANKVTEVRTDVKTREPDPTALEFQRFLRRALCAYQVRTSDRLILVLDNLDRLPDTEILSMWSTIRGMFHGEPGRNEPSVELPTVLLPIDEAAILRLHKDDKKGVTADGFISKTFDVIFRVPTPVLSRWLAYLEVRLREVFSGAFDEDWPGIAARVLEATGTPTQTPRGINAFVNQVATLWLQWRDEQVSFAAMCFYAVFARQIEADAWVALRDPKPWMEAFDPNWARSVAAMRYGVRPDVAAQILIEPPLRRALESGDAAAFDLLSRHEGFSAVLRRICEDYRHAAPAPVTETVLLLTRMKDADGLPARLSWQALVDRIVTDVSWIPKTEQDVRAWDAVLKRGGLDVARRLALALPAKLENVAPETFVAAAPHLVVAASRVRASAGSQFDVPPLPVPNGLPPVLALSDAVHGDGDALVGFRITEDITGVVDRLAAEISTGRTVWPTLRNTINALNAWVPMLSWAALVAKMEPLLTQTNGEIPDRAVQALALIQRISPRSRKAIHDLVQGSHFLDLQKAALRGIDDDGPDPVIALGLCIAAGGNLSDGSELAAVLLEYVQLPDDVDIWLGDHAPNVGIANLVDVVQAQPATAQLVGGIISHRLKRDPAALDAGDVARRANAYSMLEDEVSSMIWRRVRESDAFWSVAMKPSGGESSARDAVRSVMALPDNSVAISKRASSLMKQRLETLTAEEWAHEIRKGGAAVGDLQLLQDADATIGGSLRKGLEATVTALTSTSDLKLAGRWFAVAQHLSPRSRKALYATVGHRLLQPDTKRAPMLLSLGGDEMFEAGAFATAPKPFVDRLLKKSLADPDSLAWFMDRFDRIEPLLHRVEPPTRESFRRAVEVAAGAGAVTPEQRAAFKRLLDSLA